MTIALVTEGTYPFHGGGVSVWCDQLIRGLPEHHFQLVAITSTGAESVSWPLPANVQLRTLPLWANVLPGWRKRSSSAAEFDQAHLRFVRAVVQPDHPQALDDFLAALKVMFTYAQKSNLNAALLSNASLERLSEAWHRASSDKVGPSRLRHVPISFADALTSTDLLEHFLRPLSFAPPLADVYHAVSNGLSALVAMAGKWAHGRPFVLTEHGIYLRERYLSYLHGPGAYPVKTLVLNFFRLLSSAAYRMADLIKPGSRYNQRWELRGGAGSQVISTVYNGINLVAFPPAAAEPELPTLSWLGRIDPIKDLHTLIRAFALVHKVVPAARLRIFGTAPRGNEAYLESCRLLTRGLNLDGCVAFEGRVENPAAAYHAGHIVVLTSISEGLPYSLIEAMATGSAVVATDVGGVAEAIGEAGLLVPPRDARAVADACLQLLGDSALRRALGQAARARVAETFTLEQCLSAYRSTYAALRAKAQSVQQEGRVSQPGRLARWQTA